MRTRKYQQLTDLWEEVTAYGEMTGEYHDKMIHDIPDAKCVDRVIFILHKCMDKTVLDIGCLGPLHKKIEEVAKEVWGIDREDSNLKNYWKMDIESNGKFLEIISEKEFDLIVCGEVLEHLSNPGLFLERLKGCNCPIILTVPNGFSSGGDGWLIKGKECVNDDHVAWYSYNTLKNLVERYKYQIEEFYWAGEPHYFSEGIIFVIRCHNEASAKSMASMRET
jgi:hypothetical protein